MWSFWATNRLPCRCFRKLMTAFFHGLESTENSPGNALAIPQLTYKWRNLICVWIHIYLKRLIKQLAQLSPHAISQIRRTDPLQGPPGRPAGSRNASCRPPLAPAQAAGTARLKAGPRGGAETTGALNWLAKRVWWLAGQPRLSTQHVKLTRNQLVELGIEMRIPDQQWKCLSLGT